MAAEMGELVAENVLQPPPVLHPLGQEYGGPPQSQGHGTGDSGTHRQCRFPLGVQFFQHIQRHWTRGVAPPPDQLRKAQIAPTVPAQAKGKAQGPSREP